MTDKGRQIEEMAKFICACEPACTDCGAPCLTWKKANRLYAAGYRKQSEVVKEFVKKLKERDVWCWGKYSEGIGHTDIDELAAEYGVEVEE